MNGTIQSTPALIDVLRRGIVPRFRTAPLELRELERFGK
ncbi:MAG: hypothetical protein UV46_C0050G0003 [Candidatus Gottesmanbacteria bacterium GW2011_GWC2_42_8]|nr:MAG: hypothetical protein UV46_C0050G0003 [Candidatus Gottesmanbacteria bacterium GW2011_GWC2_42_8]